MPTYRRRETEIAWVRCCRGSVLVVDAADAHLLHSGLERGSLTTSVRSTQNQAHTAGHLGLSAALAARIEHDFEHNFPVRTTLVLQNPQLRHSKKGGEV